MLFCNIHTFRIKSSLNDGYDSIGWFPVYSTILWNNRQLARQTSHDLSFCCVLVLACQWVNPTYLLGVQRYTWSWYNSYCDTLLTILSKIRYLRYIFLINYSYRNRNYQLVKTRFMVRLVTVCSVICFLEIKKYLIFIVLKGATYVVFVFRYLLNWCFYVHIILNSHVQNQHW